MSYKKANQDHKNTTSLKLKKAKAKIHIKPGLAGSGKEIRLRPQP